jgi:hypothetical protein
MIITEDSKYLFTPKDWRSWLEDNLEIGKKKRHELAKEAAGRGWFAQAALKILAEALSKDEDVPEECIVTINKRVIPRRLYFTMAHSE